MSSPSRTTLYQIKRMHKNKREDEKDWRVEKSKRVRERSEEVRKLSLIDKLRGDAQVDMLRDLK